MWVPDVPVVSCPKTLSLGCFFCLIILLTIASFLLIGRRQAKGFPKPGAFLIFLANVLNVSQILAGMFLAGALLWAEKERGKGPISKIPRQIRKSRKNRGSPKKDEKGPKRTKNREAPLLRLALELAIELLCSYCVWELLLSVVSIAAALFYLQLEVFTYC